MLWLTVRKGLFCALRPQLWPLLLRRIAPAIEHVRPLSRFTFRTVVDVGANRGQFAAVARRLFPAARIYSFEPLAGPAAEFKKALGRDSGIRLFNNAVGSVSGSLPIYVTNKDDSSSLLKPGAMQSDIFGIKTEQVSQISVRRLSECLAKEDIAASALLKIDVQGSELDVLRGADDLIDCFEAIYVECSFMQLYENQSLFGDVVKWTAPHGFHLAGVYNQYDDPVHGPVQADFLFLRTSPPVGGSKHQETQQ